MQKVLITGATGMIGSEIVKMCHEKGIVVNYLTHSKDKMSSEENYKGFYWNPDENEIDAKCFDGVDTIINMVGATISKRWTSSYQKEIISSRTETAQLLRDTIKKHNFPVKHIVSASAIGVYSDSLIKYYEEDCAADSESFLGEVVRKWEAAVDEFKDLGITVAKIRIGLVLSNKGGALPEMAKPIKLLAGAPFGSGDQWQSWIHIHDLARLFVFAVQNELADVYNAVAPNPVTNTELTKTIAHVLNKPLVLPNIPKFAMKLVLGKMHILLFESQRVSSNKIQSEGFQFEYVHLEPATQDLLGSET